MTYKSLLVHLDGSERSKSRLEVAVAIATRFGARLTGVFGESDPHVWNPAVRDPQAALAPAAAQAEALFREKTTDAGVAIDWLAEMTVNDTELVKRLLFAARHVDLFVLGQHDPGANNVSVPPDLAEQIVLNAGRPVLIVPYAGRFPTAGERVMIAWNGSREAARAVKDALPILEQAKQVVLVTINPDLGRKEVSGEPFAAVERYLAAHGIATEGETLWVEDMSTMDMLLSRLTDRSIDLLVMGAHGQYGFPYLQRGGSTRHILQHMTVPALMSH